MAYTSNKVPRLQLEILRLIALMGKAQRAQIIQKSGYGKENIGSVLYRLEKQHGYITHTMEPPVTPRYGRPCMAFRITPKGLIALLYGTHPPRQ